MDDELLRSLLFGASSAPPGLNEQVIQEDQHNDQTAEEKESAAAQLRLDELPMGVLTKEAKQQRALARHKVMQPEDIINAVTKLGFEGSSNALSLFYSRYTEATNPLGHNIEFSRPLHGSDLLPTEMMQPQGGVNVSTDNSFRPNEESSTDSTHVQSSVLTSDLLSAETMQSEDSVNSPAENSFRPSEVNSNSFRPNEGSTHVQSREHLNEPIPTQMQRQGGVNVPAVISVGPNRGTVVQLPVHNVDPFGTEMQWEGSGITRVNPTSSFQHGGNATLLPPSSSLPSGPLSSMRPIPMQNPWSAQREPLNLIPPSSDEPFAWLMADADFARQVPIQMRNPQWNTESYVTNGFGDQWPRDATGFNAPPWTQPINQSAFPRYAQMASHLQNVGEYGTTMAADGILGSETGSISSVPSNEMMSDADLADALELLREYGVLSNEP